jgi:hypothetical protein
MDSKPLAPVSRVPNTPPSQPKPAAGLSPAFAAGKEVADSGGMKLAPTSTTPACESDHTSQLNNLTMVLERSRTELNSLLAETQRIHEQSWRLIYSLLEDSQLKAAQTIETSLAQFEKDVQERISMVAATTLQNFDVEAAARIAARLDQGLASAKQKQHSIEQDLSVAVAENRKQLDQISTGAAEGLRQQAKRLLGDLQRESERRLAELAKQAAQIKSGLEQLADDFSTELAKRTEEAFQSLLSRSEAAWQEIVVRAEKRIAESANKYITELAKQARQVVDREMSEFLSHVLRRFDRSPDSPPSNHT